MAEVDYQAISSRGVKLVTPNNPGMSPTKYNHGRTKETHGNAWSSSKRIRDKLGHKYALKAKICEAVKLIYLKEIKHKTFEFDEVTVFQMLQHSHEESRYLYHFFKSELEKECDSQWDKRNMYLVAYFPRVQKKKRQTDKIRPSHKQCQHDKFSTGDNKSKYRGGRMTDKWEAKEEA